MSTPARKDAVAYTTTRESWTEYVQRITRGMEHKDIAAAADIHVSGVSRWVRGVSRPSAEKVISFARGLNRPPVQALIAAGYLDEDDVGATVEIVQSLRALSDEALIDELLQRLRSVHDPQPGVAGLTRLERKVQDVRVEDANKGHEEGDRPL